MKAVLEANCFSGILEARTKIKGTAQVKVKYRSEDKNKEVTIMKTTTISLTIGFIAWSRPRLPLRSSM